MVEASALSVKLYKLPLIQAFLNVILFMVSVPVLSEQMQEVDPKV